MNILAKKTWCMFDVRRRYFQKDTHLAAITQITYHLHSWSRKNLLFILFIFLGKPWEAMMSSLITLFGCHRTSHHFYYLSADQNGHGQIRFSRTFPLCRETICTCLISWNISKQKLCANLMFLLFFITANENIASTHTRMIFSALLSTRILPSNIFLLNHSESFEIPLKITSLYIIHIWVGRWR